VPEPESEPQFDFDAYWMCPIIVILMILVAMLVGTRYLKDEEQPSLVQGKNDLEDDESEASD